MGAKDISLISVFLCFLLLIVPVAIFLRFKVQLIKSLLSSVARMTLQLFLAGVYLQFIFRWNNVFINILWLMIMVTAATITVLRSTNLNIRKLFLSIFCSFLITVIAVLVYFNWVVIGLEVIFDSRYVIVIGGMLLGNSLRGSIVGLNSIYQQLKKSESCYLYCLAGGATKFEALMPYLQDSLKFALMPTIASMATIGLVHLPGMMTGQILGGSNPMVAVKYQITIMIAIFTVTSLNVVLTFLFSIYASFNRYGVIKKGIWKNH
ncbi:MAG: ABC transporter permease [bacterium]